MTSSMSAARIDLCDVSPITQRSASTRLDLPQPFGPTTPVSPGSIRKSVGSTNDLKPRRRSRVSFIPASFQTEKGESVKDQRLRRLYQSSIPGACSLVERSESWATRGPQVGREVPHRGGE